LAEIVEERQIVGSDFGMDDLNDISDCSSIAESRISKKSARPLLQR
jgi:hypothetical protein